MQNRELQKRLAQDCRIESVSIKERYMKITNNIKVCNIRDLPPGERHEHEKEKDQILMQVIKAKYKGDMKIVLNLVIKKFRENEYQLATNNRAEYSMVGVWKYIVVKWENGLKKVEQQSRNYHCEI
jgi:hypothetical protein